MSLFERPGALPRVGVELELLAPRGRSRRELAEVLAGPGGSVQVHLLPDSEPSKVPGTPVFDSLTLGFVARDALGRPVARCVDDLTLQADLDHEAAPKPGWWRVLSDDRRILHLARRHARPGQGLVGVMQPLAELFGPALDRLDGGVLRVRDPDGRPVALGAPLPGERERPCEVVTPPLPAGSAEELHEALEALLGPARELGFTVPVEAAVHVHFDAAPFRSPAVLQQVVRRWTAEALDMRARFGTNPRCRRLGGWQPALHEVVEAPDFAGLPWSLARERLEAVGLSKYVDLNLKNAVHAVPGKETVEVRILPGSIHAEPVVQAVTELAQWFRSAGVRF